MIDRFPPHRHTLGGSQVATFDCLGQCPLANPFEHLLDHCIGNLIESALSLGEHEPLAGAGQLIRRPDVGVRNAKARRHRPNVLIHVLLEILARPIVFDFPQCLAHRNIDQGTTAEKVVGG